MEDLLDPLQDRLQPRSRPGLRVALVTATAVAADGEVYPEVGQRIVGAATGDIHAT